MNSRREGLANALDLGVNFIGNGDGVAVGLTIDAEQNGGLSVGGDNGVHGLDGRSHRCDIGDFAPECRRECIFTTICPSCSGSCHLRID